MFHDGFSWVSSRNFQGFQTKFQRPVSWRKQKGLMTEMVHNLRGVKLNFQGSVSWRKRKGLMTETEGSHDFIWGIWLGVSWRILRGLMTKLQGSVSWGKRGLTTEMVGTQWGGFISEVQASHDENWMVSPGNSRLSDAIRMTDMVGSDRGVPLEGSKRNFKGLSHDGNGRVSWRKWKDLRDLSQTVTGLSHDGNGKVSWRNYPGFDWGSHDGFWGVSWRKLRYCKG